MKWKLSVPASLVGGVPLNPQGQSTFCPLVTDNALLLLKYCD